MTSEGMISSARDMPRVLDQFDAPPGVRAKVAAALRAAIEDIGATSTARPGITSWSESVQVISAHIPMESLTREEVEELRGAAEFLHNYTKGELVDRDRTGRL